MAFVAAGLLSIWFVEYFQPIFYKNNEIAKLKNQVFELKNNIEQLELKQKASLLAEENNKVNNQLSSLNEAIANYKDKLNKTTQLAASLNSKLEDNKNIYILLSKKYELTSKERYKYARLAKQSQSNISELKDEILQLESSRIATSDRKKVLQQQLEEGLYFFPMPNDIGKKKD
ncbi:hypothetical protein FCL47_23510 [Desulfopila sp. IMCC35006]|uniref:hypothetical protein n=1 Tax=Desulfopila sp. IMCC35006 TaxID=2569542 RepID=UPI0010AC64B5|nr:hypothetical protein [Desulfopila sp. IMCC35006]TKB23183.1 hypothetical protein FCL47_23510 [Desulfopila sp. IMCC35006]